MRRPGIGGALSIFALKQTYQAAPHFSKAPNSDLRAIARLGSTVVSEHKKERRNQGGSYPDIGIEKAENYVGTIEIRRPPHNFFDVELIQQIAEAMEEFDKDDGVRAVLLCAQGKSFCAGANFNDPNRQGEAAYSVGGKPVSHLYAQAARLLSASKPIIAAEARGWFGATPSRWELPRNNRRTAAWPAAPARA